MSAFLYGVALQWKLDIRSKTLLVTCYVVPLLFFAVMGGIFTALVPGAEKTLIQSMTVMGVSMGALVGLPPSLVEVYGSDIKKAYKAGEIPLYLGWVSMALSAFIHLLVMCAVIYFTAPVAFGAALPADLPRYIASLAVFVAVSLAVGSVLGLAVKSQSRLTMLTQLVFLPSIMLSGIMFPAEFLPRPLEYLGKLFPAAWGYRLMAGEAFAPGLLIPLAAIFLACIALCGWLLAKRAGE